MKDGGLRLAIAALMLTGFMSAGGADWKNLDKDHRIGGRMVSEGYLRGKVVLVNRIDINDDKCRQLVPFFESVWESYKSKQLVIIGSVVKGSDRAKVAEFIKENKITYPVYDDAEYLKSFRMKLDGIPCMYLVDETGAIRHKGKREHDATERMVEMLTDMEAPKNQKDWERYLGWEVKNLPGRALKRIEVCRKEQPETAKKYDEDYKRLSKSPEVKKLAELVEFSRRAKDYDVHTTDPKLKIDKAKIEMTIKANEGLKKSKDPQVVQEAKNALADLKWALQNF